MVEINGSWMAVDDGVECRPPACELVATVVGHRIRFVDVEPARSVRVRGLLASATSWIRLGPSR